MSNFSFTRLLVIGDIHGDIESLSRILMTVQNKKFDAILLAGDIGLPILFNESNKNDVTKHIYLSSVKGALDILSCLRIPIFYIPGNWDIPSLNFKLRNSLNVDLGGVGQLGQIGSFNIAGFGGSSYVNGHFPYEWSDEECLGQIEKSVEKIPSLSNTILIIHDPPHGTDLDINFQGEHRGSKSVRHFLDKYHPLLSITGHIHESSGVMLFNNQSLVINAGGINVQSQFIMDIAKNKVNINLTFEEQFFIIEFEENRNVQIIHYSFRQGNLMFRKYLRDESGLKQIA